MGKLIAFIGLLLFAAGCTSYPRYSKYAQEANPEKPSARAQHTVNDYIRFGLILQEYLGKPYRGKSRYQQGVDCSMFTSDVFRKFNKTVLPRSVAEQYREGREVRRTGLAYGDLVFFRTERRKVSHVGVYIDHNEFIHATNSRGVIISNLTEKYWAQRYAGARRVLNNDGAEPGR